MGVVHDASILLRGLSVRHNLEYAAHLRGHSGGRSIGEVLEQGSLDALDSGSFNMLIGSALAEELDVGVGEERQERAHPRCGRWPAAA